MTPSGHRILFVYNNAAPFVRLDMEVLRQWYRVSELYLGTRWINPHSIWRRVGSHDLTFGWFASWHTFLPTISARLLGKPSVIVVGGYDVAKLPAIGYGHQRGGLKKLVSLTCMRNATCLVTHSQYSRREVEDTCGVPRGAVHVIHLGIADPFGELGATSRPRVALTVGNVDVPNLWRKGHEPFVRAAALLPDVEFVLAGEWKDGAIRRLRSLATPNVTFTGWVDRKTLQYHYSRASVYLQLSAHEGFGMSLAEAMLAGCIPLVTRKGALPEVVGDCGIYVDTDPAAVAAAVREALSASIERRQVARQRILDRFSVEAREKSLLALVDRLLHDATRTRSEAP